MIPNALKNDWNWRNRGEKIGWSVAGKQQDETPSSQKSPAMEREWQSIGQVHQQPQLQQAITLPLSRSMKMNDNIEPSFSLEHKAAATGHAHLHQKNEAGHWPDTQMLGKHWRQAVTVLQFSQKVLKTGRPHPITFIMVQIQLVLPPDHFLSL